MATDCSRRGLMRFLLSSVLMSLFYLIGLYNSPKTSFLVIKENLHTSPTTQLCTTHKTASPSSLPTIPHNHPLSFSSNTTSLDFGTHHSLPLSSNLSLEVQLFPYCDVKFVDYCPCQDPIREKSFSNHMLFHRERHCPNKSEVMRCLIPRPKRYKNPFPWPKSREWAWYDNVPYKTLTRTKSGQNWVRLIGQKLFFPGGGTSFPAGAEAYVKLISRVVPLKSGVVRTVLDVGCGVASFGAALLDLDILTMSVAPRDIHHAQVQFALERGLPAMLGILSMHMLPVPSRSFDLAHCSRCLVNWTGYGGLHLMEVDRVLRPGAYWVLSGPPIAWKTSYKGWEMSTEMLKRDQDALELLAKRLCWKKIAETGPIAVWRKPTNHMHCIKTSNILNAPPFCQENDSDSAWYRKMEACITPLPKVKTLKEVAGGSLQKWPKRLNALSPGAMRGKIGRITSEIFNGDNQIWKHRVLHYGIFLSSLTQGRYRNIMDMNAGIGGFAAALYSQPVWVMNVVPLHAKNNTLGIIYERGLIGTYMDWCEAFSTYPRTYDFIHANGVFSMYMDKCDITYILLEMDRILRPAGAVVIRDHVDVITKTKMIADSMRWQSQIAHSELGPYNPEKLLIVDNSPKVDSSSRLR